MTKVAKYNTYKGFSTALTFATPIITMLCVGDFFKESPKAAVSGVAVFALLLSALFLKDKLAEKFKTPSALIIAIAVFVLCVIVENIIKPVKAVSLLTIITCGIDELTFKNFYKHIELGFPAEAQSLKRFGFYFAKQGAVDALREVKHENT